MSLAAKKPRLTILQETPIVLINCPTRRRPINYPVLLSAAPFNAPNVQFSPKSDYAGNGGDLDPDSAGVGWWQFPALRSLRQRRSVLRQKAECDAVALERPVRSGHGLRSAQPGP